MQHVSVDDLRRYKNVLGRVAPTSLKSSLNYNDHLTLSSH